MLLFGFAIVTYATFCLAPSPLLGPPGGCQSSMRISLMSVSLTPFPFVNFSGAPNF